MKTNQEITPDDRRVGCINLYKRSGIWWMRFWVAGKETRRSTGTRDLSAAKKLARAEDARVTLGQHQQDSPVGWQELFDAYLRHGLKRVAVKSTVKKLKESAADFEAFLGDKRSRNVTKLKAVDMERFIEALRERGLAKSTVREKVRLVKAVFAYASRVGRLADDPLRQVQLPSAGEEKPRSLSPDQMKAVLAAADRSQRLVDELRALHHTGMRSNELCRLEVGDVDLERRLILIRHKAGFRPKHGTERDISIRDEILPLFRRLVGTASQQKSSGGRRRAVGSRSRPSSPRLFAPPPELSCDADGGWKPEVLWRQIKRLGRAAGVHDLTTHRLRHTFCSEMARAGVTPYVLRDIMGHASLETTMRYYDRRFTDLSSVNGIRLDAAPRPGEMPATPKNTNPNRPPAPRLGGVTPSDASAEGEETSLVGDVGSGVAAIAGQAAGVEEVSECSAGGEATRPHASTIATTSIRSKAEPKHPRRGVRRSETESRANRPDAVTGTIPAQRRTVE